jgi:hypothetical protein
VLKFRVGQGRKLNKVAAAVPQPAELALITGSMEKGSGLKKELKQECRQTEEEEEQEDACGEEERQCHAPAEACCSFEVDGGTFGSVAEAERAARGRRLVAHLDHEHALVEEHQGELACRCQRRIFSPAEACNLDLVSQRRCGYIGSKRGLCSNLGPIYAPLQWLHRDSQHQTCDARGKCQQHTGLLGVFMN